MVPRAFPRETSPRAVSVIQHRAVELVPHRRKLPLRYTSFVLDKILVEFYSETGSIEVSFQHNVSLRHRKRFCDITLPEIATLDRTISLRGLQARQLMRQEI